MLSLTLLKICSSSVYLIYMLKLFLIRYCYLVSVPVVVTTTSIKSSISTTIQISTSRLLKTVSDKKTSLSSVSKKKTVNLINTSSKAKRKRKARLSTKRKLTEDDEQPVCKVGTTDKLQLWKLLHFSYVRY